MWALLLTVPRSSAALAQIISYWNVPPEERNALGIKDGLIRFACGVEETEDILADVSQALDRLDVEKQYLKDTHEVRQVEAEAARSAHAVLQPFAPWCPVTFDILIARATLRPPLARCAGLVH